MTTLALVLVLLAVVAALIAWLVPAASVRHHAAVATLLVATGAAALLTMYGPGVSALDQSLADSFAVLALAQAVAGGGPLALTVLALGDGGSADGNLSPEAADPVQAASNVLRGGAWIGVLERVAVFAAVVAGWPEGLAVALAVKGLGRYPELRTPGAAERFIIGTFVSVLWAVGCAALLRV